MIRGWITEEDAAAFVTILNGRRWRRHERVSAAVPADVRRDDLSFDHHAAVSKVLPREQRYWLARAAVGGWSVTRLRVMVTLARAVDWWLS